MAPLSLKFQHILMFARPARTLDDLVLPNPMQGNLPLRYACSAQTLSRKNELSFFFNICNQDICIYSKNYNIHLSRGGYYFFFFSLKSHKAFKLVLLVAGGRAIANRPGSSACIRALTLVTWKWLQGLGLFDPFRYPMCSPVIMSARAAKVQHYVTLHVGMHTGSTRGLTVHLQRVWRSPWCDILLHSSSEIPGKLFREYREECCSLFSHLLHGALVLFESQIAC